MPKRPTITTPKGRLKYPRILGKPDTKFNADGVWQTQLILDPNTTAGVDTLLEQIKKEHEAAITSETAKQKEKNAGKKIVVKAGDLPYSENEDGTVELRFKLKVKGENTKTKETWTNTVAVFDAKGKPLTAGKIGSGTLAKVAFEFTPFYVAASKTAGVSLRLKAVQCIEIVEFGGDASQYGFGAEDDDSETETAGETTDDTETETADTTGSDF